MAMAPEWPKKHPKKGSGSRVNFKIPTKIHDNHSAEFPLIYGQFPNQAEKAQLLKWMGELERKGITVDAHVRLFVQEFMEHIGDQFDFLVDKFASRLLTLIQKWETNVYLLASSASRICFIFC